MRRGGRGERGQADVVDWNCALLAGSGADRLRGEDAGCASEPKLWRELRHATLVAASSALLQRSMVTAPSHIRWSADENNRFGLVSKRTAWVIWCKLLVWSDSLCS